MNLFIKTNKKLWNICYIETIVKKELTVSL